MGTRELYGYEPDYAVPPGETLQEVIDSLGMTQRELAVRTGLTVQTLARIMKGEQPITYATANLLELATGVPARMWNSLEAQYRERLAKLDEREQMRSDLDWLREMPVSELQARGHVGTHADKVLVLRDVLAFYAVGNVSAWREIWGKPEVAARRSTCFETCPGPASAWIREGEILAQGIACDPYNRALFLDALGRIRALTQEKSDVFRPEMVRLCAGAGVAVVFVPEMRKVPWNGATKWLTADKVMILLSLRGKCEDRFWFSFFHEAGHVIRQHRKKELFINDGTSKDEYERDADAFASEFLIPQKHDDTIRCCMTDADIRRVARSLGISPGIVAGRYQFLTNKWNRFKTLIRPFDWKPVQKGPMTNG